MLGRLCSAVSQSPMRTPRFLTPFHSPNAGGEIGAEKTGIGRFTGETPHGAEAKVDGPGCNWNHEKVRARRSMTASAL
jgi:hypothetical protein